MFLVAASATGFFALVLGQYVLPGGDLGTIMGILFGIFVVKLLVRVDPYGVFGQFSFARGIFVFISEAVMGFGIAISGLKMPWPFHGVIP